MAVVSLHQGSESIQERFGAVQRIYMQLRLVIAALFVRVKHHGGNVKVVPFRADTATLQCRHRICNHNGAHVAGTKDLERGFN